MAEFFNSKIDDDKTWRINLRRRHSQLTREEIISAVAEKITKGTVKLEKSDYYIYIETLGKWTYLSLSSYSEFSLAKMQIDDDKDTFTF